MPYNSPDQAPNTLPQAAKKIWVAAFNNAYESQKGDKSTKDSHAAKIAWGAVKKQFVKKGDGWVRKQSLLAVPMPVVKLSKSGNRYRWLSTLVTDKVNTRDQRLDESLFYDFINNFSDAEPPVLDICHLSYFLADPQYADVVALTRLGLFDRVYADHGAFKSGGYWHDTPIAYAIYQNSKDNPEGVQLQTSAGFVPDYGNVRLHDDILTYYGGRGLGYLDHGAVTGYPVDENTDLVTYAETETGEQVLQAENITMANDFKRLFGKRMPKELHPLLEKLGLQDDLLVSQSGMKLYSGVALPKLKSPADEALGPLFDEDEWAFPEKWPTTDALAAYSALPAPSGTRADGVDRTPNVQNDVLRKIQRTRARQSGVGVKANGKLVSPTGNTDEACWGDPTNYLFPLDTPRNVALSALAWPTERTGYTTREQAIITGRMANALKTQCGYDMGYGMAMAMEDEPAYGGATTLADAIAFQKAHDAQWQVEDYAYMMREVADNIEDDDELSAPEKTAAINDLIRELGGMMNDIVAQGRAVAQPEPVVTQTPIPAELGVKPPAAPQAARQPSQPTGTEMPAHRIARSFADAIAQLNGVPAAEMYQRTGDLIVDMAQEMHTALQPEEPVVQQSNASATATPEWAAQLSSAVAALAQEVRALKAGQQTPPVDAVVQQQSSVVAALQAKRKGLRPTPSAIVQARGGGPAKSFGEVTERLLSGNPNSEPVP